MFKQFHIFLMLMICSLTAIIVSQERKPLVISPDLEIEYLSDNAILHRSYLQVTGFGRVGCNGLIYLSGNEAYIFDTPATDSLSKQLLDWIDTSLQVSIKAIVATHFHDDCLGGLQVFHDRGITSYSSHMTQLLAAKNDKPVPQAGFSQTLYFAVESDIILCRYFGKAHTSDNIVAIFPDCGLMFGGCMVKSAGAGKGNLEDASVEDWPTTVAAIREQYPDLQIVVPGHGKPGGMELLDYTIDLFSK